MDSTCRRASTVSYSIIVFLSFINLLPRCHHLYLRKKTETTASAIVKVRLALSWLILVVSSFALSVPQWEGLLRNRYIPGISTIPNTIAISMLLLDQNLTVDCFIDSHQLSEVKPITLCVRLVIIGVTPVITLTLSIGFLFWDRPFLPAFPCLYLIHHSCVGMFMIRRHRQGESDARYEPVHRISSEIMVLACLVLVIVGSVYYGTGKDVSTGFCNWITILALDFHLVQNIILQTLPKSGHIGSRSLWEVSCLRTNESGQSEDCLRHEGGSDLQTRSTNSIRTFV